MALGKTISTWFRGAWHKGDLPILSAADHGGRHDSHSRVTRARRRLTAKDAMKRGKAA